MMSEKCVTCGKDKDPFSKEWGYSQCEKCSMVDYFKPEPTINDLAKQKAESV